MNRNLCLLIAGLFLLTLGCSSGHSDEKPSGAKKAPDSKALEEISSFEECAEAGYPIMRSMPPKCATSDGRVFTKGKSKYFDSINKGPARNSPKNADAPGCKNQCGDGTCQQMVCMAIGCPCAETPQNCPDDCASPF